jgi:transcriptional regulator GlxA family with amidase domain
MRSEKGPLRLVHLVRGDEHVEKALRLMRAELGKHWTVSSLARQVGLSRPAFARRFAVSTGQSPLKYLTRARMARAAQLLVETDWGLARVGVSVGYDSEFAFNRAFKRVHHVSPGAFRRTGHVVTPMLRAA